MKLSLVVAQGVHTGKTIPVTGAEFLIGRDPQCHLRPASPAVSKQHCAITDRDGITFIRDCGSMNGTFVNGEQIAGEMEIKNGDTLRVGPLEFRLRIDADTESAKSSAPSTTKTAPLTVAGETISTSLTATVVMDPPIPTVPNIGDAPVAEHDDADKMAAMLLGMDDAPSSSTPTVEGFNPDSTTVMEMPAIGAKGIEAATKKEEKKHTDSASAAAEVLSKYMRRPRT